MVQYVDLRYDLPGTPIETLVLQVKHYYEPKSCSMTSLSPLCLSERRVSPTVQIAAIAARLLVHGCPFRLLGGWSEI